MIDAAEMKTVRSLNWPLMQNNITREDLDAVIEFLKQDDPILTQSKNVRRFEDEWSKWLGVKYSVFVNSGSSANQITMAALRHLYGEGEIIVPTLTWVSDIAAVLQNGLDPVFVDIDPHTLGMDVQQVMEKITPRTKAIFLTHILGYNALRQELIDLCEDKNILLLEDVCESHGATFEGRKLGSIGFASNFSFYYAHHMSTIEGGMVCTNDEKFYQTIRMFRSHGMVRECTSDEMKQEFYSEYPDLNPDFIFAFPAYNVRSTEINAVMGLSQLRRLDENNRKRTENLLLFLNNLDASKYWTEFATEGSSNYAFTLIMRDADDERRDRIMRTLREHGVEFRRGTSGGGNQLRQPYLRKMFGAAYKDYPVTDHVHFYGFYIGNYPELRTEKILQLCEILNSI